MVRDVVVTLNWLVMDWYTPHEAPSTPETTSANSMSQLLKPTPTALQLMGLYASPAMLLVLHRESTCKPSHCTCASLPIMANPLPPTAVTPTARPPAGSATSEV